jgi:hypothetical protein
MADFKRLGKGVTGALAQAKSTAKAERAVRLGDRELPVTMHPVEVREGNVLADINPQAFDKAFRKSNWQYVGPQGEGGIGDRYKRFEEFAKDAPSMRASNVSVNKNGAVTFGDGRHRYAYLRDQGVDSIPMSMDKDSIENARLHGFLREEGKARGGLARMAGGGALNNSRDSAGLDDYSNYGAKENSKMVNVPGVGEILTFWDHPNKRVIVSDEGYWNPKSPTGDKLALAIQWARDQGYEAGVVTTPYASDRFGDGVTTTAGGHSRAMPGASDQQLRDYIDAADFVVSDPYLISAATATPEMQNNFASFTKNIGDYANSQGKDTWLYLQGFKTPDVDAKTVEDYNTKIATENAGRYNDVSFFNMADFGHAGNPNEDHTGFTQIDTQGTVDAASEAVEPFKMAEKGGFDLPPDWSSYDPAGKIKYFNENDIDTETLRNVGVAQEDIDWMQSNGYVVGASVEPTKIEPQNVEATIAPEADNTFNFPVADYSGLAGYSPIQTDGGAADVAFEPPAMPEMPVASTPDYSRAYTALGGEASVLGLRDQFLQSGLDEGTIESIFSNYYAPESTGMARGGKVLHMADAGKVTRGVTGALTKAKEMAKAKKAGESKIEEVLAAQQAPMTRPQGTGLPLMPRDQGMYTPREQKDLPRMPVVDKARAAGKSPKYNERMQDLLDSPTARKKVDSLINKGKDLNMKEWYGTEPLRQVAMDAGRTPEQFESLMAQLASASQRNPVDKQNQMGSYLYHLSETGQLPENSLLLTNKLKKALKEDPSLAEGRQLVELPTGYGSLAQGDIFNRAVMIGQGKIGEALPPNKKLGTFYENLLGNLQPVTVDVNAVRGPIIERGDPRWLTSKLVEKDETGKVINSYKPREMLESGEMSLREAKQRPGFWEAAPSGSEYAGFEDLWQRGAKRHGVAPAEAQALGWYGSADVTALKTKPENYVDNLERMIKRTAEQTGKSPSEVMDDMVTGKGFLRKDGGKVDRKETEEELARFHKRFAMHKAIGGHVKKMAGGGKASIFDAPAKRMAGGGRASIFDKPVKQMSKGGSSDEPTAREIAEALGELAVAQGKEEYQSFKKPRAATDIGNRGIIAPALGLPVDMMNMGLSGVDALTGLMGKPTRLSSEKPFAGSEHIKDLMNKYGVTSGEDRPMTETMLSLFSPTGMVKGAMNAPKIAQKTGSAIKSGLEMLPKDIPVGMSIKFVGDMTPKEMALAKMREMRPEFKEKSDLMEKYNREMDSKHTRDMPSFEDWKAKQAKKARGGLTLVR